MIVGMKFRIQKYFQVFNKVGMGYGGLTRFILVIYVLVFPEKDIILVLLAT
jgi:hypothetical protein